MELQDLRQKIFEDGYNGVIKQGKPSYDNDDHRCVYRHSEGLKCALGHCIKDEYYHGSFDTYIMCGDHINIVNAIRNSYNVSDDVSISGDFLLNFQRCHDNNACYKPEDFVKRFKISCQRFAEKYDLTMPDDGV